MISKGIFDELLAVYAEGTHRLRLLVTLENVCARLVHEVSVVLLAVTLIVAFGLVGSAMKAGMKGCWTGATTVTVMPAAANGW